MQRKTWKTIIALACLFMMCHVSAQNFNMINGFGTPLCLNGGYAGTNEQNELALQVQKTGGSVAIPGFNHVATFGFRAPKLHGGLGLIWTSEFKKHLWTYSLLKGVYALHLQLQENLSLHPFLSLGLGINHLSEDYALFGSSLQGPLNKAYFTPGAGVLVKYGNFYAGFSGEHFTRPDIGWENIGYTLEPKYILHLRYRHELEPGITLQPGLIGHKQGSYTAINPSVELDYQGFITGVTAIYGGNEVFSQTGLGGMIGVDLKALRIIYCFAGRVAGPVMINLPSHEFSMSYRFGSE